MKTPRLGDKAVAAQLPCSNAAAPAPVPAVPPPATELRIEDSPSALWRAAACELSNAARSAVAERGRFAIALSGGSTPRSLYELLASDPGFRDGLPWAETDVFWSDERHVPPDHPDSNYGMAREALLSRVPLPARNVYRVHAELSSAPEAAAAYEREIRARFGLEDPVGSAAPRFDLILLGLGHDGHTASLFPGSPLLRERERLVAAGRSGPQGTWRITLTLPVLNASRRILFLVAGEGKAEAVRRTLDGGSDDRELTPAALVRPVEGRLLWLLDREAASLL